MTKTNDTYEAELKAASGGSQPPEPERNPRTIGKPYTRFFGGYTDDALDTGAGA